MPSRAVVIAVENYSHATDLGKQLPGTLQSAQAFRDWLVNQNKVAAANIQFLQDPSRLAIERAFRDLVDQGRDATEKLYVFFSGHGFSFQDAPGKQKPADILVAGDFENLQDSGLSCLKLDELQDKLYDCLGPGDHYYFLDACRNQINASDVSPTNIGWVRAASSLGTPTLYTLFSAERLNFTVSSTQFTLQLVDGLSGKGRAKRRDGMRMVVTFDSLCDYLEKIRSRKIDRKRDGDGRGEILEIAPIPQYKCTVEVPNAGPADSFTLLVQNGLQQTILGPQAFSGKQTLFSQPPDDYYLQVQHPTDTVQPAAGNHADLYEDCTLTFTMIPAPPGAPPAAGPAVQPASVSVSAAPDTTLLIENLQTGETIASPHAFLGAVGPGDYYVRMKERDGRTVRRHKFSVAAGDVAAIDVAARPPSIMRDALLGAIPGQHDAGRVDFSETLGPMADDDLGLWLSIIGASRIVGARDDYSKLKNLPLPGFDDLPPGGSAVFALLGLEDAPSSVSVSVAAAALQPAWTLVQPTPGLHGVYALAVDATPGQRFISVRLGDKAPLTVASFCLPHRVTLFTLVQGGDGPIGIHQYMLPASHLIGQLQPVEQEFFHSPPLRGVRFIALAQKQLAARRRLRNTGSAEEQEAWNNLLYGKWLDPVMAVMACFELLRSGAQMSGDVLHNLTQYYGQLPDVAAIVKRAGGAAATPQAVPLFLAGVREFPDLPLPFPRGRLDYSSPWTTWIGAL